MLAVYLFDFCNVLFYQTLHYLCPLSLATTCFDYIHYILYFNLQFICINIFSHYYNKLEPV